jgi:signal transduction histidine kinase
MLPRAFWVSLSPADALGEAMAVTLIGSYIIYILNAQAREKTLRQEADMRQIQIQQRLNEVSEQITSELELDRILTKVLQIAEELTSAAGGGIALFDPEGECFQYPYLHNLPQELAKVSFSTGEGVAGEVMRNGCPVIVSDYKSYPQAISAFTEAGLTSVVAVPILKGDHIFGALTLVRILQTNPFLDRDVDILNGIGRQAGIAIENARLYERMRFYAQQITRAQEDERKRVARDLHDDTVQMLIALSRRIESLATDSNVRAKTTQERLSSLQEMVTTTLHGLRRFIQNLRPPTLDHLGLLAALEGLTAGMTEDHIDAELSVIGDVRRLPSERELVLFRVVQEAMNNIRRHSEASHVLVQVRFFPDRLRLTVEDNGHGFDVPARLDDLISTGRLGLIGMHERVRMLDGTLNVQSNLNEGTTLIVEVPTLR